MSSNKVSLLGLHQGLKINSSEVEIGYLVRVDADGAPFLRLMHDKNNEVKAHSILQLDGEIKNQVKMPLPVLVAFDNNKMPIILNVLFDKIFSEVSSKSKIVEMEIKNNSHSDRKILNLEALDEINIRCGKSEIILRKNGKVIIKGAEVISRASNSNKIKGANVLIN